MAPVPVRVRPHAFSTLLITQPDRHITSVRRRNEDEAAGHVIIRKSEQPGGCK